MIVKEDGIYLDCTFGRGGHSESILQSLGVDGRLLAFDKDSDAVNSDQAKRMQTDSRFEIEKRSFSEMEDAVSVHGWRGRVSGILMDLGVSSPQLDEPMRGFSFLVDGPLDMRMDPSQGLSAAEWLSKVSENDLVYVLKRYGEERFARRIARAIIKTRENVSIATTSQLAEIIEQAIPVPDKHKHPATRSFQAIRIFINKELEELKLALAQTVEILKPAGRLVVIAFHSLEDRIVKRFIRSESRGGDFPVGLPVQASAYCPRFKNIGKAIKATAEEVAVNHRARSAVLRVAERLP